MPGDEEHAVLKTSQETDCLTSYCVFVIIGSGSYFTFSLLT